MYLEQLRSFCAVVEAGSLTQAARALHLSQPAVTQHVRSLEQAFQTQLLERVRARMRPTEAGEAVYRHGREIVRELDALRDEVSALRGLRDGSVVVGASITAASYVLPRPLARFRQQHPAIRLTLRIDRTCQAVVKGTVDFTIAIARRVPEGCISVPLYQDPLLLVVGPTHPLARHGAGVLPAAAVSAVELMALAPGGLTREICDEWLQAAGVAPRIAMEFDNFDAIKQAVAGGYGAAFLFGSAVASEVASGALQVVPLQGTPLYVQFSLVRRLRQRGTPAARALLAALLAELPRHTAIRNVNASAVSQFFPAVARPRAADAGALRRAAGG